jgi:RHS repeat-associated protein
VRYLYAAEDLVGLFTGSGHCQTHAILHGPGIDQPLAFLRDTNADCSPFSDAVGFREPIVDVLSDALGSPVALTSETHGFFRSVVLAERTTYDSFGTPTLLGPGPDARLDTADDAILPASAYGSPYAFTGREYDPDTGLSFYRARYYDPHTGTFLQEDPIRLTSGNINFYEYAGSNPVRYLDPLGLAYFGKRSLKGWPIKITNPVGDVTNTEPAHEHIFFEDGYEPSNIGFGPQGLFTEPENMRSADYERTSTHYDDALMREAVRRARTGEFQLIFGKKNNCQDYATRVRTEYQKLLKERSGAGQPVIK